MSWHLHGTILTDQGTAGNNRGDSEGNKSTLQKVFRNGEPYTTVSAEAIRYALREGLHGHESRNTELERRLTIAGRIAALKAEMAEAAEAAKKEKKDKDAAKKAKEKAEKVKTDNTKKIKEMEVQMDGIKAKDTPSICLNRTMPDHKSNEWHDKKFSQWQNFFDDDVLGYMNAKEQTDSHRGILEITRAISSTPWRGEVVSNYATPGSNPGVGHNNPIPYAIEVHHTRYQYTFTLTPEALAQNQFERTKWLLDGLISLRRVGGNHAHFLFDFAPVSVVLRWTEDPAPRIMYCFDEDEYGTLSLERLRKRVDKNDIVADELWIGSVVDLNDLPSLPNDRSPVKNGPKTIKEGLLSVIEQKLKNGSGEKQQ